MASIFLLPYVLGELRTRRQRGQGTGPHTTILQPQGDNAGESPELLKRNKTSGGDPHQCFGVASTLLKKIYKLSISEWATKQEGDWTQIGSDCVQ